MYVHDSPTGQKILSHAPGKSPGTPARFPVPSRIGGGAAYLEAAIPVLEQSLTGIGVTIEKMTETLAGEESQGVKLCGMLDVGMPIYQEQVYLKKGNYIAIITLCSGREDMTAQMAAMFYALDK